MDDRAAADLQRALEKVLERLDVLERRVQRLADTSVTAEALDALADRSTEVTSELQAIQRLDIGGRLHRTDEMMQTRINRLQSLSDQWADMVNVNLGRGGLKDLNSAVSGLARAQIRAAAIIAIVNVTLVVLVLLLA